MFLKFINRGIMTNQLKRTLRASKMEANKGRKKIARTTDRLPPSGAEGDYKKKGPGLQVRTTKVPETTLKDASVTGEDLVSHEITSIKDLKTNSFKDSPTESHDAERPDGPIQLAYVNKQDEAGTGCQDNTVP